MALYWVYSGGSVESAGIGYTPPGGTFTRNLTNYIEAGNWGGACPYLQVYDTADPDESKQLKIDQSGTDRLVYSGGSGSDPGSSSGGANGNPIGDMASTNDLRKLGEGLQLALDALAKAVTTRASEGTLQGFTNAALYAYQRMISQLGTMTNQLAGLTNLSATVNTDTNSLARMTNQLNAVMSTTNYLSWVTNLLSTTTNLLGGVTNGLSAVNTNLTWMGTNLAGMGTNLYSLTTNVAGIGTNIYSIGTNLFSMSTNVAAMGTNLGAVAGMLEGWTNGAMTALTNWLGKTNETTDEKAAYYSNLVADADTKIKELAAYGEGLSGAAASWQQFMAGEAPAADWGVIKPKLLNGTQPPKYWIDMKILLRLDKLELAVPGLRGWVRNLILWAVIVGFIVWLMSLLREGVWHALTPPPMPSNALQVGTVGAVAGPLGVAGGMAGAYVYKAGVVLALFAALMMLPSILIAVASTTLTAMGADPNFLAANSGVVSSAPNVFWKVVNLTSPWIPIGELGVAALNGLVARFSVDGCVTFLMFYVRVSEK